MSKYVVTGGAGFIGSNLSRSLLGDGHEVTVLDNLSRKGVSANLEWLKTGPGHERLSIVEADVRDSEVLARTIDGAEAIFHFAGQVAVTSSLLDPRHDFEVNARGTFNLLEVVRACPRPPAVLFTSTNKVYGSLSRLQVRELPGRYELVDCPRGVDESEPLDFHSPYGCSKGTADQYVRDYSRIYGLRTVVFRMSCIYGTRQFGTEDQGWVAHLMLKAFRGEPVNVFGNGKQVRDLLYVADLVRAFKAAASAAVRGESGVFNLGGGQANTLSIVELLEFLERRLGHKLEVRFGAMRPGDQPIYVSDTSRAKQKLDWAPEVSVQQGLELLADWLGEVEKLFGREA
jgi:CDP-paratose 2-epimerase